MSNKTVYLVKGEVDLDIEELPPLTPEEVRAYLEAFIYYTLDFETGDGFSAVGDSFDHLTTDRLLARARDVMLLAQANPIYREKLAESERLERVAIDWVRRAEASYTGSGPQVAKVYGERSIARLNEAKTAILASTNEAEVLRGAAKFGVATSRILGPLPYILAITEGAYTGVPDTAAKGMFAAIAGSVGIGLVTLVAGGPAVLAALATAPLIAAVAGLALAGYLAGKFGEFIWDAGLGDQFWSALESIGIKDDVEQQFQSMSSWLNQYFPSSLWSEGDIDVQVIPDGSVTTRDNENIVVGNDGNNVIKFDNGRNTAFGYGGFDIYDISIANVIGNQVIVDSDGQGDLKIDGVSIAAQQFEAVGFNYAKSLDGEYSLRLVVNSSGSFLIVNKKGYSSQIIVNDWSSGDLGLTLPEYVNNQPPSDVTHPGSTAADYINPYLNGSPTAGIHADGGTGRDMIWGTSGEFEDVLKGGEGSDIINGNGGKDQIDGGAGDDFISAFGDESIVKGGDGNDVIAADYDYGWNFAAFGPIDENGVWKDLQQYFGWQQPSGFTLDESGDLKLYPGIDLAGGFDHSGPSGIGAGWSYRFWLVRQGRYELNYFSPSNPNGVDVTSGVITYSNPGIEFTKGVSLYGGAGNDTITGSAASDFIDGGEDNDLISGGAGNDVVVGGSGSDDIAGGADNDVLDGGEGVDWIHGEAGNDVITGGGGDDFLWGDAHISSTATGGGDDFIDGGQGNDQIAGQAGNDLLAGGDGNDFVFGDAGDDRLLGGQGADELQGGDGNDRLDGGTENDKLFGEAGNDTLLGGAGVDQLMGGDGNDRLDGGADNDTLFGQAGNDVLAGGTGDDQLQGGDNDDSLDGGEGIDKLFGEEGNDYLSGGAGNDELRGDAGQDSLNGGAGLDLLSGGDGNDTLDGGVDRDMIYGEAGDDRLLGGTGDDYLDGDETSIAAGLHGRDEIDGGAGNDVIHGQGNDDIVRGGDGDDSLFGDDFERLFAGNDEVRGGAGKDYVNGGAGNDTLFGDDGDDTLVGDEGNDVLTGGAGADLLVGGKGNDRFHFERGFGIDRIIVIDDEEVGADTITFGSDIASSDLVYRVQGQDLIISLNGTEDVILVQGYFAPGTQVGIGFADGSAISRVQLEQTLGVSVPVAGTASDDTMSGTEDNDRLHGGGGNDTLYGMAGDDYLNGGSGNDTLYGGVGHDVLEGGTGNDIYHLDYGFGIDTVLGLGSANSGSDVIRFGPSLTRDMISNFQVSGEDLMIGFVYGSPTNPDFDVVTLTGFLSTANGTHIIEFADGTRYTASDFLEGPDNWDGTNDADDYVGSNANNNLNGYNGDDRISGLGGNDSIYGGYGNDTLNGDDGNDSLVGDAGQDVLNGGAGDDQLFGNEYSQNEADTLRGGSGNDRYYLSSGYQTDSSPDTVIELADEGTDSVYAGSYSYTLTPNVENLIGVYTSTRYYWQNPSYPGWYVDIPRQLRGNELDNTIQLGDLPWNGTHFGHLYLLDGGIGADTLIGTAGNETYVVDQAGDRIVEPEQGSSQSIDTVRASYSYSLAWNVNLENVELVGTADLSAWGNVGNNKLDGSMSAGTNALAGGEGNDIYVITPKDSVIELAGQGIDTVVISSLDETSTQNTWFNVSDYANVENLKLDNNLTIDLYYDGSHSRGPFNANLQGDSADNVLTGNGYSNEIRGGGGNDTLIGGERELNTVYRASLDSLYGEAGDDTIRSGSGGAHIHGGLGNDLLYGAGGGDDSFHYAIGDGRDTINSYGSIPMDRVVFGEGIDPDAVQFTRSGTSLVVQVGANPDDQIIVSDYWYESDGEFVLSGAIDQFVFADGTIRKGDLDQLPYTNNPPVTQIYWHSTDAVGGEAFSFALPSGSIVDEAGDTLTFRLSAQAPEWLNIDAQTGTITGTPPSGSSWNTLEIIAADSWGQTTNAYLSLRVRNLVVGTDVADVLVGTSDSDELRGLAGNDRLVANGPADRLIGGAGDDTYVIGYYLGSESETIVEDAGGGYDTVEAERSYWLSDSPSFEHIERIVLTGTADFSVSGAAGSQTLIGNSGNNQIDGRYGADTMQGGAGNDTYFVDFEGDSVVELANEGKDTVYSQVSYQLTANVEDLTLEGADSISGTGNELANSIYGNSNDNRLDGGAGADKLYGGAGDDYFIIDQSLDRVYEDAGNGLDTIERRYESSSILVNHVENLVLAAGVKTGNGNALDNRISGNEVDNRLNGLEGADILIGLAGNDTLDGGAGDDRMEGGVGNDIYLVDSTTDVVVELAGEGVDTVQATASYTLGAEIENITLMGTAAIDGAGNALANALSGNEQANVLRGMAGNDTLDGNGGLDTLHGGLGDDTYVIEGTADTIVELVGEGFDRVNASISYTLADHVEQLTLGGTTNLNGTGNASDNALIGNSGVNTLTGLAGNDTLDGKGGADTLTGGLGNDIYYVDNANDVVQEAASEGTDIVHATLAWTLGANLENLQLLGTSNIAGTGNTLDNLLTGNSGNNTLTGLAGNDVLEGLAGNDTLDGGIGTDTLKGGLGDDTYVVESTSDVVTELAGEGNDLVNASATYTLSSEIEKLTLTGTTAINGTGNASANILTGNTANNTLTGLAGNDTLDGKAGADTLKGGTGDDIYVVDNVGDAVTELVNEGNDLVNASVTYTLASHVEKLTLTGTSAINGTGNTSGNVLTGNSGNNALSALAGNDTLEGKGGTDTLTGGTGNDVYLMARTYGSDTVVENDATAGNTDVARFLTGVAYDQLWFTRPASSNNLEISIIGTTDKLVIKDWYLGGQYRVEEIRTDDGAKVLYAADVQALVTKMAGMTPPPQGQTTLSASQRTTLEPTFASTWRNQPAGLQATTSSQPASLVMESDAMARLAPAMSEGLPAERVVIDAGNEAIQRRELQAIASSQPASLFLENDATREVRRAPAMSDGLPAERAVVEAGNEAIQRRELRAITSSQPASLFVENDAAREVRRAPAMSDGLPAERAVVEAGSEALQRRALQAITSSQPASLFVENDAARAVRRAPAMSDGLPAEQAVVEAGNKAFQPMHASSGGHASVLSQNAVPPLPTMLIQSGSPFLTTASWPSLGQGVGPEDTELDLGGSWPVNGGESAFDVGSDLYALVTSSGFNTSSVSCGEYELEAPPMTADCNGLIQMMARADRYEARYMGANLETLRVDYLTL